MSRRPVRSFERCPTLVDLLRARAEAHGDEILYRFLVTGDIEGPIEAWSYAHLDARARALGELLAEASACGERALLLYPPGLEFVAAFMGCLYAGVIAVPAYPPDPTRLERTLPRLRAIAHDCGARFVLTTADILGMADALLPQAPEFAVLRWVASDATAIERAERWRRPDISADTLAFLQYTSGSTGSPKGVMVSHANVLHNEHLISHGFGHDESSVGVGWLPLFHDMGLIGNVLQPLYMGFPCALMSPIAFLQRPERWLRAISHFRATTSGGPNFAYDLCVRKVGPAARVALDLRTWSLAFNGAEPIRRETLERFAEAFAVSGFRREAFYPCYGLAEATLIVAGGRKGEPPVAQSISAESLTRGRFDAPAGEADARWLVSSGRAAPDLDIIIVDPETRALSLPGEVGEIWVHGPSVAKGYWGRPDETAHAFGAHPSDADNRPYMRSGDLGFLHEGELFVTGRLKDMIVLRGQNHYPQDIEQTVETSHPCVRPGCSAAFALEKGDEERLVVAAEVELHNAVAAPEDVIEAIRYAVAEEHAIHTHAVVLLKARTIPKTSSGKIQRNACRTGFLAQTLDVILAKASTELPRPAAELDSPIGDALTAAAPDERLGLIARFLKDVISRILRVDPERVRNDASLMGLGLDSLMLIELQGLVENALELALPSALFWQHTTLDSASAKLLALWESAGRGDETGPLPPPSSTTFDSDPPPSSNQLRLWFLDRLVPESASYNVHFGLRMRGRLQEDALKKSLDKLVERHTVLRTVFREAGGRLRQMILPARSFDLPRIDLSSIPEAEREAELHQISIELARKPFDLAEGPLLRALLLVLRDDDYALLMTQHHIVTDGWSISVLQRELASFYRSFARGSGTIPPPPPLQYADYARWQRSLGNLLDAQRSYWAHKLAGLPRLELPIDRARPRELSHRGATLSFLIPTPLAAELNALSRREGITLFVTLFTAYATLLYRYTGQDDFGIGTVAANRDRAEVRDLVGFFANTLVLRCDLSGRPTFLELLSRLRLVVAETLANADLSFDEMVELSRAPRSVEHNPLFQVSFVFENLLLAESLVPEMTWSPLLPTPGGSVEGTAKFDLELLMLETPLGLRAAFEYSTDLFDHSTIQRMVDNFESLLRSIVAGPEEPITELSLLSEEELRQVLAQSHGPPAPVPSATIHELFEAQARQTPERIALQFEETALTYAELDARASRLARELRARGVRPEFLVGLAVERSLEMVIGLLAILKAGGAYVPLDPDYPAERLAFMIRDARISLLLTQEQLRDRLPLEEVEALCLDTGEFAEASQEPLSSGVGPDELAYVIYTSGSTGRPKGVAITHGSVVKHCAAMAELLAIAPSDVLLAVSSISFDIAALELFMPLLEGVRVVIASGAQVSDGAALATLAAAAHITLMQATPVSWQMMLDAGYRPSQGLRILCGGEALSPALAKALSRDGATVFNAYGPTEATIWATAWRVEPESDTVRIGRPLRDDSTYVLDTALRPLPINVPGELYIGGGGVARAYLDRPELTASRFLPDPFSSEPGARMYRTGDLVRWRADGNLEFIGRADHQIKLRGRRIELGEIEAVLSAHPAVHRSVVLLREDILGDPRIVAYVVLLPDTTVSPVELRKHIARSLPAYMIPSALVVLDAFPLTPNSKVDRKALPAPDLSHEDTKTPFSSARTPAEEIVSGIFAELLGLTRVGAHDDFFDLGGHSLLAIRVISRLRAIFGVELPLRELFEAPIASALAARIDARVGEGRSHLLESAAPPINPALRGGELPLSFAQERLWFLDQLEPRNPFYNLSLSLRLQGRLDIDALARALARLVSRHEALRTTFETRKGRATQIIHPAPETWQLPLVEIHEAPSEEREKAIAQLAHQDAARPFDLVNGPLLRTTLLRLGAEEHVLFFTLHHIVSDGWSTGILTREIGALYSAFLEGCEPELPELPIQYADYAVWQRRFLESGALDAQIAYWRERLAGAPILDLPISRPRPPQKTYRGRNHAITLSKELTAALIRSSREHGATLFMTLLAAFAVLLHRYSRQDDLCIGTPVAGRDRAEIEPLVGCFVNTLVLRLDLSNDPPFSELLRRVRDTALSAYSNQHLPFERLVDALAVPRDPSRTPLFQVAFVLQNAPMEPLALPGLSLSEEPIETHTSKFDLTLSLGERHGELTGAFEYNTDLFDVELIERLAGHFSLLLADIALHPERRIGRLDLLSAAEKRAILFASQGGATYAYEASCVHRLFEGQTQRTPASIALSFGDEALSYAELNTRANQLAHYLQALGIGPGTIVGLCVERSLEMVIGILGILKAGGAYLPLDPDYPEVRLAWMLEHSRARVVVTRRELADKLPRHDARLVCLDADSAPIAACPRTNPYSETTPNDLAYIIYTSGSTGLPKGVRVCHRHITRLFDATEAWFSFDRDDVWTLFHSYAFDFSVWEIWGALLYGARLVIVPYLVSRSPAEFRELLCRERVTVLNQTPSAFRQLIHVEKDESSRLSLRYVIFGGEALDIEGLRPWFDRHGDEAPRLINMYGITETTVHVTYRPITRKDLERPTASVIGRPIPDLHVYLLDAHGQIVPMGIPGEIHVGGAGVADGYLHVPALTAERFVPDTFSGESGARLYRSGDLARMRPSGELEYLGRIDHQVKIHGFRIELGEIEAALGGHPDVREAVVMARRDDGDARLVAYIVPRPDSSPRVESLREQLQSMLPAYMVPAAFVLLDALPLTPSGKVDRKNLPAPSHERPELARAYAPPRTPGEELLSTIFANVLGLDRVGIDDNYFELGGDSIRSIQVISRARDEGLSISVEQLFRHQTVRELFAAQQGELRPASTIGALSPFALITETDRTRLPRGVEDAYPITALQAGMIFHSELDQHGAVYHDVFSFRLEADLDPASLGAAAARLARRHPVLRTSFDLTSFREPLQLVHELASIPIIIEDLRALSPETRETSFSAWYESEKSHGFSWNRAPLLRFYVHRFTDCTMQFTVSFHHAILDGWSVATMLTELFQRVLGERAPEGEIASAFRDFVALERETIASSEAQRYWAERLEGIEPFKLPRPARKPADGGHAEATFLDVAIAPETMRLLQDLAHRAGVPIKSVLLTAHAWVMRLLSGRREIVTGLVANGRPETRDGEQSLGLYLNTLPFRIALRDASWIELIRDIFSEERSILPHRRVPLSELQRHHGGPLFDAAFNFTHFHVYKALEGVRGLRYLGGRFFAQTNFALMANFSVDVRASTLKLQLVFSDAALEAEQMREIAGFYERTLMAMARDPHAKAARARVLSEEQTHRIIEHTKGPCVDFPDDSIHHLFEAQARRTPEAIAIVHDDASLSYCDLDRRANQLAHHLRALGVGPEARVGLCVERSLDTLIGILAILKAGGAYVPLDPKHPRERLAFMLDDAQASACIARPSSLKAPLPERVRHVDLDDPAIANASEHVPPSVTHPDNLAYIIYTSGSTGRPKGVMIQHRSVVHLATALGETVYAGYAGPLRVGMNAPIVFDASVKQWIQLLRGYAIHIVPEDDRLDAERLLAFTRAHRLDVLDCTPAQLSLLLEAGLSAAPDRDPSLVLVGGEAIDEPLWARLGEAPKTTFINVYGPTECTVDATAHIIKRSSHPALGRPLPNVRIHILDQDGWPTPDGVAGEIHIAGQGLARGYLCRPAFTAQAFIPDPFGPPGARLYKTGDLGRRLTDGTIEYLGRIDQQVKVRGYRIELGEIESALAAHPALAGTVVIARDDRIVAYCAPGDGHAVSVAGLRNFLLERLPDYMVPSIFVMLDALPLTHNGKIDRRALPAPETAERDPGADYLAPRTPIEEAIARVWAEVLGLERVGRRDHFFALGGHSLLATQVISRVRTAFDVEVPLKALFEEPTVERLAQVVEGALSRDLARGRAEEFESDNSEEGEL